MSATPVSRSATAAPRRELRPLRLVLVLGGIGAILLVVGLATQIIVALGPEKDIFGEVFFNPDREANAWSWFSTLLLAALSLSLAVHAALRPRGAALPLAALALLALYMSLDEAGEVHEKFEPLLPEEGFLTVRWLVFGVPLAVVAGAIAYLLGRRIGRILRRRLVVADSSS